MGGSEFAAGWEFYKNNLAGKDKDSIDWASIVTSGALTPKVIKQLNEMIGNNKLGGLFEQLGGAGEHFTNFLAGTEYGAGFFNNLIQNYEHYINSGGTQDDWNLFSTPEERAAREAAAEQRKTAESELEAARAELDRLRAEAQILETAINNRQNQLSGATEGQDIIQKLLENDTSKKAGIDTSIIETEEKIKKLEKELAALDTDVVLDVDTKKVDEYKPPVKRGIVLYSPQSPHYTYAEGGRATTASIFGEAGPEWAIPEEHSERTADLLAAAARASGFTWNELLARNGGLNGNANSGPNVTIGNYAPVINAGNAAGVAQALEEDKERLKQIIKDAIREGEMQRDMRKYA